MSQLSEIRTAVQANWPDNYHDTFLTDTKTDEYINAAQRWICRGTLIIPAVKILNYNFSWMKTEVTASTVDSQRRYALPDGTSTPLKFKSEISCELVDVNSKRRCLTRKFKQDIENDPTYNDTTDTGKPAVYCVDDFDLWLYPLPNHAENAGSAWTINLEYYGYLADLSGDIDTNTLTNDNPLILEYGATELGFRYGQDKEQADYFKSLKIEIFLEMVKADQQLEYSGIEVGMQPRAGSGLGEAEPGTANYYTNDTPYD
ncbi:MAG: hypothetical protein HWN68_10035 [Desulfobacterales bacterium]|nr:hypothetical protein [Desulfobacterales bacterium]